MERAPTDHFMAAIQQDSERHEVQDPKQEWLVEGSDAVRGEALFAYRPIGRLEPLEHAILLRERLHHAHAGDAFLQDRCLDAHLLLHFAPKRPRRADMYTATTPTMGRLTNTNTASCQFVTTMMQATMMNSPNV